MSGGIACNCLSALCGQAAVAKKKFRQQYWRVTARCCNHSAFNGYHRTWSDYSEIVCLKCGSRWRTKAKYVATLREATPEESTRAI